MGVGMKQIFCRKFGMTSRAGRENRLEAHNGGGQIRRKAVVLPFKLLSFRLHKNWAEFSAGSQRLAEAVKSKNQSTKKELWVAVTKGVTRDIFYILRRKYYRRIQGQTRRIDRESCGGVRRGRMEAGAGGVCDSYLSRRVPRDKVKRAQRKKLFSLRQRLLR